MFLFFPIITFYFWLHISPCASQCVTALQNSPIMHSARTACHPHFPSASLASLSLSGQQPDDVTGTWQAARVREAQKSFGRCGRPDTHLYRHTREKLVWPSVPYYVREAGRNVRRRTLYG